MNLQPQPKQKPWWNRPIRWNQPLLGKISLLERLFWFLNQQQVPELAISLHNQKWDDLNKIAPTIQMQDNETYNQEFLDYISIKYQVENNQGDYKGLNTCINVLRFAIDNNTNFRNIYRIELDYQGKTQLELYDFVLEQLENNLDLDIFKQNVQEKIDDLMEIIRNDLIKNALRSYLSSLDVIAKDQIGLNLLLLFKKYNIASSTIFDTIVEIINQLKKQELSNLKALVLVAKVNYEKLETLGRLIGVSNKSNQPITYAKILQYITLCYKYDNFYFRFQQLIDNLKTWEKHYHHLNKIRQEYPNYKFKLPTKFVDFIPGENLYHKYKDYLLEVE